MERLTLQPRGDTRWGWGPCALLYRIGGMAGYSKFLLDNIIGVGINHMLLSAAWSSHGTFCIVSSCRLWLRIRLYRGQSEPRSAFSVAAKGMPSVWNASSYALSVVFCFYWASSPAAGSVLCALRERFAYRDPNEGGGCHVVWLRSKPQRRVGNAVQDRGPSFVRVPFVQFDS